MAIAEAQNFGIGGSATATSLAVTVPANTVVGNMLIIRGSVSGGRTTSGATDTRGNTWTFLNGPPNGTTATAFMVWCVITAQMLAGDTITVNFNATGFAAIHCSEMSGLDTSGGTPWRDVAFSNNSGAATAVDCGTATTTQAGDLIMACIGYSGSSATLTASGYTIETARSSTTTIRTVNPYRKVAGAAGAETAAGSYAAAKTWSSCAVAFKAAASTTQVSGTRRVAYNVQAQVSATRRVVYNVAKQVAGTRRITYAVTANVAATRRVGYAVVAGVVSTRRVNYVVTSGTTQVAGTRRVAYTVQAQVAATRRVSYAVAANVAGTRRVNYVVAAPAAGSASWRTLTGVGI